MVQFEEEDAPGIEFEWYPAKAETNRKKHGISFELASTVFGDRHLLEVPDREHSVVEERFVGIGRCET